MRSLISRGLWLGALGFAALVWAAPAGAQQAGNPADSQALDQAVAGKPAVERPLDLRLDVVAYDVSRDVRLTNQLQKMAEAGGGGFSTAGINDIQKVMSSVVSGQASPTAAPPSSPSLPGKSRLEIGDEAISHGRLDD
ncbi:MAG: hypothetical protein KQJ78_08020 [Deltaproteobacteria bacterium]|nr:hypothetical protein [Deltaproteobacteria bacterium]MCB2186347.1 hypothetical protein [Deltaproteobacteria bacterium]